jgi:predicted dehydrogenase
LTSRRHTPTRHTEDNGIVLLRFANGAIGESSFAGAIDALLRAIVDGTGVPVPGEEGRKSLELVLAAYRSIETRQAVSLPLEA